MTTKLSYIGYLLALIGGIILILFGILSFFGSFLKIFTPIAFLSGTIYAVAEIGFGIICIIGSKYVTNLTWAIILIIFGIAGGNIGGTLVILGALIGLVVKFTGDVKI
jgi:hypothetical protein